MTVATYLKSDCHEGCGGRLRPNVVLYEEGLHEPTIQQAFSAMLQTDLVMIIGTSFQVYPFRSLIDYVPAFDTDCRGKSRTDTASTGASLYREEMRVIF